MTILHGDFFVVLKNMLLWLTLSNPTWACGYH